MSGSDPPRYDPPGSGPQSGNAFRISSLVLPVYLPAFLFATGVSMVIPVLPLLAQELGATLGLTGTIVALKGLGNLAANLPAGVLVTKIGDRRTMIVAMAFTAVVAVTTGFAASVPVLSVLTFIAGLGQAGLLLSRMAYLRASVPANRRGRALSIVGGVMRVGALAGPIAGGFIGSRFGLQAAFFGQAAAVFPGILLLLAAKPSAGETVLRAGSSVRRIRDTVVEHRSTFMRYAPVIASLALIRAGRDLLFPLWGNHIGLPVSGIGLVIGIGSALEMTLFYVAGTIMDRWGRKWAVGPCMIIVSVSLALLPLTGGFVGMLLVALLAGVGNGLGSGVGITMGTDLAPVRGAGEFLGVWHLISDVGRLTGPVAIGAVAEALALAYSPLVTAALGAAGAIYLVFFTRDTLHEQRAG